MTNYNDFKDYFDLLEKTLSDTGLKDKPAQIYNCDESGMLLEFKMPKVIAAKGTKRYDSVVQAQKYYSCLCQWIWTNAT